MTVIGPELFKVNAKQQLESSIGTLFPRHEIIITAPPLHAMQREAFKDWFRKAQSERGEPSPNELKLGWEAGESVDLFFAIGARVIIRPELERLDLAFEADEMLQNKWGVPRHRISFMSVAVVNETFARRFLPGSLPIGKHFKEHGDDVTIIGVVKDGKYRNLTEGSQPYYYRPFLQSYSANSGAAIHLRTSVPAKALLAAVRREVQALDPRVAIFDGMPMTDFIGASQFTQKLAASLLSLLGSLALLMAAIGLYGVMAYGVAQRRREIGIRMALGARREDVLRLILRDGMKLVVAGVLAGFGGAFLTTRVLGHLLLDVNPADPPTLLAILLLLCAVAFLACWLPALRATRVDPMEALRYE